MPLFIALFHVPQGTTTKRYSPPSDLVKTHFHFFLPTQLSSNVTTYKKFLEYGIDPLTGFGMPNTEAITYTSPDLATFYSFYL